MAEVDSPHTDAAANGTAEPTSKEIENLRTRIQAAVVKARDASATPSRTSSPAPDDLSRTNGHDEGDKPLPDTPPHLDDGAHPASNLTEVEMLEEGPDVDLTSPITDDCTCQALAVESNNASCARCHRVIPVLADLHRQRLQQLDDLEVANSKIKEEFYNLERQNDELEGLRKRVEELEDEVDVKTDQMHNLQRDMSILNDKYVDEIEKVAELQHSKEVVESQLEELTATLFQEANVMVADERKKIHDLTQQQKLLENQLKETQDRLAAESLQLKELRDKMEQMNQVVPEPESKRSSRSDPSFRASIDFAELFGLREKVPEAAATLPPPTGEAGFGIDPELLAEFGDFVEQSKLQPLKNVNKLSFMKHCLEEDVDPCMRFGNNSRVSPRKIVDSILNNTCCIEEAPPGADKEPVNPNSPIKTSAAKPLLWERFSGNVSPHQCCQCCGRGGALPFQFRVTSTDDWSLIDRYCRDRMVAVCEFYVFIRNIRQGLYSNRTVGDLYSECLRLRLQMFYARLGALPAILNTLGLKTIDLASARKPMGNVVPADEIEEPTTLTHSSREPSQESYYSTQEVAQVTRELPEPPKPPKPPLPIETPAVHEDQDAEPPSPSSPVSSTITTAEPSLTTPTPTPAPPPQVTTAG